MKTILAVGAAGAVGGVVRTLIGFFLPAANGFPTGTFVVNIAGTFILCFLVERTLHLTLVNKTAYDAITVGFLGAFTTFSAFSYESFTLFESNLAMTIIYVLSSIVLGLFAGALGFRLGGRGRTE